VPLSGSSVRFDYASLDPASNRLYISHMDADQLLVVDVRRRRIVATIPAPAVHGVIAVPQLARVYASATNARQVLTINMHTDKVLVTAPAGDYPDGLAYDPVDRHAFVSDESGGVDVQSQNQLAVIDPDRNSVIRRISVPSSCNHDDGLNVDSPRRLAFIACDGNARLLTFDLNTMTVTGTADVGSDPDVLAFDPGLRRLYVAAESGIVAVFAEHGQHLRKLGQAFLASEAHTVAVDPRTHLVYFPLQVGTTGKPQLLIMKPDA
jgi:DNA-binding beta-propeller fold protein YncE